MISMIQTGLHRLNCCNISRDNQVERFYKTIGLMHVVTWPFITVILIEMQGLWRWYSLVRTNLYPSKWNINRSVVEFKYSVIEILNIFLRTRQLQHTPAHNMLDLRSQSGKQGPSLGSTWPLSERKTKSSKDQLLHSWRPMLMPLFKPLPVKSAPDCIFYCTITTTAFNTVKWARNQSKKKIYYNKNNGLSLAWFESEVASTILSFKWN